MREANTGVFIVVRAVNEAARLGATLDALCAGWPDVVVVDDGSSDDTPVIARDRPVWLVRHAINCGAGAALRTGLDFALSRGARAIVSFDADGQHDAAEIAAVAAPVLEGRADVVIGSRFLGRAVKMPFTRWIVLKGGALFTRLFSRLRVSDPHNGFRCFSPAAAQQIRLTQPRMAYASELIDEIRAHRLRLVEVPVTIRYTDATLAKGQSSWNALRIAGEHLLGRLIR